MKKRITIITLTLAALIAVPLLYAGHERGGRMRAMHGGGFGAHAHFLGALHHVAGQLDLTAEQEREIKRIMHAVHDQNAPYREQMHGTMKRAAELLIANPADVAGAQSILDAKNDAERALEANLIKGVAQGLAVLTPEQRTELGSILAKHMAELESRRGR